MELPVNESKDPKDRFGMPESAIRAAMEGHCGILRAGMYVPTREEVGTWPPEKLYSIIVDWLWESPSEIIPTRGQIAEVLAVLEARPDADQHRKLIAECREYTRA